MRVMRYFLSLMVMALVTACTPADEQYCRSFGVLPNNGEYPKCLSYFHQQESAFAADAGFCSARADQIYPPTLYDYGHTGYVHTYDPYRGFSHIEPVDIAPDYQHNAEVDALRGRIIVPCMDEHGWNSPTNWQAGRHAVKKSPPRLAPSSAPLPWGGAPVAPPPADLPWLKH